jgi:nitrous oxidase accessory protein NosD
MRGNRIYFAIFLLINFVGLSIGHARTFYISPAGDDSNPGTSPDQAWRTLDHASASNLVSGDSLLLQRGGVWHESFAPTTDGLTLAAYGDGDRPIIDAAQRVGQLKIESTDEPNIFRTRLYSELEPIWSGTARALTEVATREALSATPDSCFHDHEWGYVHVDAPSAHSVHLEVPERETCMEIKHSRFTLRSITICHAGRADRGAISVWADQNLHGITIEDCKISDNHGRGIWICGPPANSIRDVSIRNNQFLRNDSCGLLMTLAENSEVQGNQFVENCRQPIEPWQAAVRVWSDGIRNLDISNNIILGQRWHLDNDSAMGIHCDETGPVVIRDNFIRNVDHAGIEIENTRGITAEKNVIVDTNIGIFINRAGHDHIVRDNTIVDSRSMAIFLHSWRAGGMNAGPEIEVQGKLLTHNLIEGNRCFGSRLAELSAVDGGEITAGALGNIYRDNDLGPERVGFIQWGTLSLDHYADWPPAASSKP